MAANAEPLASYKLKVTTIPENIKFLSNSASKNYNKYVGLEKVIPLLVKLTY